MPAIIVKSLEPQIKDSEVNNRSYGVRFISFESCVKLFQNQLNITETPSAYRITEQGIEVLYK